MRQVNLSYAKADACYYEAIRINKGSSSEWSQAKEGNALIDTSKTHLNYELIPHHKGLNPSNFRKHNRGQGIADYHRTVTGRTARMKGEEGQLSKAVGCIITLPRDYLSIDYGLTKEEFDAITHYVESGSKKDIDSENYKSAIAKINAHEFTEEEQAQINDFFTAGLKSWQEVAGIRNEDMLYAVVHMDESYPHLHIMALPTVKKENGAITFSTSKFNNTKTHYYDHLHENVIKEMASYGIDASGLVNGATKGKGFTPGELSHEQREESVRLAAHNAILQKQQEQKEKELNKISAKIDKMQGTLLEEEQVKKLLKDKSLKSLISGGTVNVDISYELAQSLKKSELTKDTLEAKETLLDERERDFFILSNDLEKREKQVEKEVEQKVQNQLPQTIQKWQEQIPLLEERERKLKQVAKEQALKEEALNQEKANIEKTIAERVREAVKEIIEKILVPFKASLKLFMPLFEGEHQKKMAEVIQKYAIIPERNVDLVCEMTGINIRPNTTVKEAMRSAEARDIKHMLHEEGLSYSDMDSTDIVGFKKKMNSGMSIRAAIMEIIEENKEVRDLY